MFLKLPRAMLTAKNNACLALAVDPSMICHVPVRPHALHPPGLIMRKQPHFTQETPMTTAPTDWTERSQTLAAALSRVALGDRAQAEDTLQECFVNIWRAAQGFDPARAQPMTWLTSIARNRAIDSLRRRKAEVVTVNSHTRDDDDSEDRDLLAALPSSDAGPLELLQQAAKAQNLTQCIGRLSAEQQQCVALAYYQGLSHAEVAQHLVQPLGTVKSWVRRALMALKDCLGHTVARSTRNV